MPDWAPEYLEALNRAEGVLTKATELIRKDYKTVYNASLNYPDFAKAIDEIKAEWDDRNLAELEDISMTQAKKPGCFPERAFQMKALAPEKYRDLRTVPGPGNIKIILGHPIARSKDEIKPVMDDARIIDADVEGGPKTISKGKDSILSDDEVDIDV